MTDTTSAHPDENLTVIVDGKPAKLFMSFGMLDLLLKEFTDEHPVEDVASNPTQRLGVVKIALAPRGKDREYGLESGFDPEKNDIDVENVTKILEWVLEHVTDFFIRQAEAANRVSQKYKARMASLTPSENGSKA